MTAAFVAWHSFWQPKSACRSLRLGAQRDVILGFIRILDCCVHKKQAKGREYVRVSGEEKEDELVFLL